MRWLLFILKIIATNSQISETKHNIMNNNYLNELKHDTTRQLVVTTRGIDLQKKMTQLLICSEVVAQLVFLATIQTVNVYVLNLIMKYQTQVRSGCL